MTWDDGHSVDGEGGSRVNEIEIPPRAGRVVCAEGTMDQPGRNHPGLGTWLIDTLIGRKRWPVIVDPMCGAGQLWLLSGRYVHIHGSDLRPEVIAIARQNQVEAVCSRAEVWTPPAAPDLVAFSPSYPNADHGNGESEGQKAIREEKGLQALQTCPGTRNLLPVFLQIGTYCGAAPVAVIVRNWIERNREVDWVSEVEQSMRFAGYQVERFWRRLLPGPFTQMKLKSGKQTAWVDREWVLVGRLPR